MIMKILLMVFLLLVSFPLHALEECFSGSWYDTENPGSGIDIQVLEDQTVGYYYAYGSTGKAWYVMLGEDQDLQMIATLKSGDAITEHKVGSASIEPIDDNTLNFSFDIVTDIDAAGGPNWCLSGFCGGDFIYTRLTKPIPC